MPYPDYVNQAANQYGLDPALLVAQQGVEDSSGDPNAVSSKGAVGVAQLMPKTAANLNVDPTDKPAATMAQAKIMRQNLDKYGDLNTALMAYHGGPNQNIWGPKTQAYPGKILAQYIPSDGAKNGVIAQGDPLDSLPAVNHVASQGAGQGDSLDSLPAVANHPAAPGQAQPQEQSVSEAPPPAGGIFHAPLYAGSQAIKGATIAAGIPGDLERAGMQYVGNPLLRSMGQQPEDPNNTLFPTSDQTLGLARSAGLVDQTNMQPENPAQRQLGVAAEGVGTALPFALTGPGEAVLPTLAAGAGGNTAADLAHTYAPGAEIPAGIAGSVLAGGGASLATRGGNILAGNLNPAAQDFADAGIPVRSPAYVANSPGVQAALKPGEDVAGRTAQDLGNSVEQVAAQHGASRTLQQAGEAVQSNAQDWLKNTLPAKVSAAWAPIDSAVPATTPVPTTAFSKALDEIRGQGGAAAPIVSLLKPSLPAKIGGALDEATGYGMTPLTYQDMSAVRSAIGGARGTPEVVEKIGDSNLSRLYAAATTDMRNAVGSVDPSLPAAFDAANAESSRLYGIANTIGSKITKSSNPAQNTIAPEAAAKSLLGSGKNGDYFLSQVRSEMPQAADELGALKLRQAGLDDPESVGSVVSNKFPKQWASLSPEAKEALYPDPAARAKIDATVNATQRVQDIGVRPGAGAPLFTGLSALTLGGVGEHLGEVVASHLGAATSNVLGSGAGAALAGAALPYASRIGANILSRNAALARLASVPGAQFAAPPWRIGAATGINPLYPQPQQ